MFVLLSIVEVCTGVTVVEYDSLIEAIIRNISVFSVRQVAVVESHWYVLG